jgi:polyphosphate kinase
MREGVIDQIDSTIAAREAGDTGARIRMKMNSLVDRRCIRALYRASQAGVEVALNVRGICCLRPGVEGVSEKITVTSVLGRFLEHARIYSFERDGQTCLLIGSADLMPRNLDTRVELITPVEDDAARRDLLDTLDRSLATEQWAWELRADGRWRSRKAGDEPRSIQRELMMLHAARASEGTQADDG